MLPDKDYKKETDISKIYDIYEVSLTDNRMSTTDIWIEYNKFKGNETVIIDNFNLTIYA